MFDWVVRYYIGEMFHSRTVEAMTASKARFKVWASTPKESRERLRIVRVERAKG